jgi:ATP-dependent protease ClpP protease subunit
MRKFLLGMIASMMVNTAASASTFDSNPTMIINREITGRTLKEITSAMNTLILKKNAPKVVNIILDSPGGSVYAGFQFISQMKTLQAKGTTIVCYVPGMAASMAFHILVHCNERIVLQESALLWHRARVFIMMGVITSPAAAELSRSLEQVDIHILNDVKKALKKDMSDEDILYHFNHETMHIGQALCASAPSFCKARSHVPGLMEALKDLGESGSGAEEDSMPFQGTESLIYIYQKYFTQMFGGK